jgi:undecaprenyl pyrophosphate phosphatase UppP
VSGLVAIWALLRCVRRHSYAVFVDYRLRAAVVVVLIVTAARDAGF